MVRDGEGEFLQGRVKKVQCMQRKVPRSVTGVERLINFPPVEGDGRQLWNRVGLLYYSDYHSAVPWGSE